VSYLFGATALELVYYNPAGPAPGARPLLSDEDRRAKEARFKEGR